MFTWILTCCMHISYCISYRLVSTRFNHCFSPFFQNILGRIATTISSGSTMWSTVRRMMRCLRTKNNTSIKSPEKSPGMMHRRSPSQCPQLPVPCISTWGYWGGHLQQAWAGRGGEWVWRGWWKGERSWTDQRCWEGLWDSEGSGLHNISVCYSNPYHFRLLHVIPCNSQQMDNDILISD